jgi:hypothetical protein
MGTGSNGRRLMPLSLAMLQILDHIVGRFTFPSSKNNSQKQCVAAVVAELYRIVCTYRYLHGNTATHHTIATPATRSHSTIWQYC